MTPMFLILFLFFVLHQCMVGLAEVVVVEQRDTCAQTLGTCAADMLAAEHGGKLLQLESMLSRPRTSEATKHVAKNLEQQGVQAPPSPSHAKLQSTAPRRAKAASQRLPSKRVAASSQLPDTQSAHSASTQRTRKDSLQSPQDAKPPKKLLQSKQSHQPARNASINSNASKSKGTHPKAKSSASLVDHKKIAKVIHKVDRNRHVDGNSTKARKQMPLTAQRQGKKASSTNRSSMKPSVSDEVVRSGGHRSVKTKHSPSNKTSSAEQTSLSSVGQDSLSPLTKIASWVRGALDGNFTMSSAERSSPSNKSAQALLDDKAVVQKQKKGLTKTNASAATKTSSKKTRASDATNTLAKKKAHPDKEKIKKLASKNKLYVKGGVAKHDSEAAASKRKRLKAQQDSESQGTLLNPAIGGVLLLMSAPAGVLLILFGALVMWVKSNDDD